HDNIAGKQYRALGMVCWRADSDCLCDFRLDALSNATAGRLKEERLGAAKPDIAFRVGASGANALRRQTRAFPLCVKRLKRALLRTAALTSLPDYHRRPSSP